MGRRIPQRSSISSTRSAYRPTSLSPGRRAAMAGQIQGGDGEVRAQGVCIAPAPEGVVAAGAMDEDQGLAGEKASR